MGFPKGPPWSSPFNPNATFQVGAAEMGDHGGFSNLGFSFSTSADLLVGQDVQIRPVR